MNLHYNAFISYRHHPQDIRVAVQIHRSLERLRVPKAIRQRCGDIERIFRDKEELPITSDLTQNLTDALTHSDFLIVICSTHTRESIWVRREIETFLQTHDRNRVLTVLVDGEPQDTIPEILQFQEAVDPVTGEKSRIPVEPLSCDWRIPRKKALREELPRLAAALLGCGYDELRQRQHQYRVRRTMGLLSGALAAMLGLSAYFISTSIRIRNQNQQLQQANTQIQDQNTALEQANAQIQSNLTEALRNQSQYLASAAQERLEAGDRLTALSLALAALPGDTDIRPYVPGAEKVLADAAVLYQADQGFAAVGAMTCSAIIHEFQVSDDTRTLYIRDANNVLSVWDTQTFQRKTAFTPEPAMKKIWPLPSGNVLLEGQNQLYCYSQEGEKLWALASVTDYARMGSQVVLLESVPVNYSSYIQLSFLDAETGERQGEPLTLPEEMRYCSFLMETIPENGTVLLRDSSNGIFALDRSDGTFRNFCQAADSLITAGISEEGNILLMVPDGSGFWNGQIEDMHISSPGRSDIYCFDGESLKLLWASEITSYQYGENGILSVPGTGKLLCYKDCTLLLLDGATGEILGSGETSALPMFVEVEADKAWGILQNGDYFNFTFQDNQCISVNYFMSGLGQADWGNGVYVCKPRSRQVTVYRSKGDPQWQPIADGMGKNFYGGTDWYIGSHMVNVYYRDVSRFDMETHTLLWETELSFTCEPLGLSPDEKQLLFLVSRNKAVGYMDLENGTMTEKALPELEKDSFPVWDQALMRQEKLYFPDRLQEERRLNILDLNTWELTATVPAGPGGDYTLLEIYDGKPLLRWEDGSVYWGDVLLLEGTEEKVTACFAPEEGLLALGSGDTVALFTLEGKAKARWSLGEHSAVSLCIARDQVLVICNDTQLRRFTPEGQLLGALSLFVYAEFFQDRQYDGSTISWTFLENGDLILNVYAAGNIIDCEQWAIRGMVGRLEGYLPELNRLVARGDGLGSYPLRSTEEVIAIAREQLGDYQLSQEEKEYYGID